MRKVFNCLKWQRRILLHGMAEAAIDFQTKCPLGIQQTYLWRPTKVGRRIPLRLCMVFKVSNEKLTKALGYRPPANALRIPIGEHAPGMSVPLIVEEPLPNWLMSSRE